MKKFAIFASMLLAFLSPLVAFAEEEKKNPDNSSIRKVSFIEIELNLLGIEDSGSGSSLVFDPDPDPEAKQVIGPDDRRKLLVRVCWQINYLGKEAELLTKVCTDADDFNWSDGQDSGYVEIDYLPFVFLSGQLKIGVCHKSSHNLTNGDYGGGTNITCLEASFDFNESLNVSGKYNLVDKASPYFLTADASEIPVEEIGRLQGTLGFEWVKQDIFTLSAVLYIDDEDDLASIKSRLEIVTSLHWPNLFFEYHRNVKNPKLFGQHELLLGPVTRF